MPSGLPRNLRFLSVCFLASAAFAGLSDFAGFATPAQAEEHNWGAEFGGQAGTSSLLYLQPSFKKTFDSPTIELNTELRGRVGTPGGIPSNAAIRNNQRWSQWQGEVSIRALSARLNQNKWALTVGFQEIPWGETFGFSILDLVNPRDFRDPLILDPSWTRLPVMALNQQLFLGAWTFQSVFTPIPRGNLFPAPGSAFDITSGASGIPGVTLQDSPAPDIGSWNSGVLSHSEFGEKINYLFENGLDFSLLYFRHWNRNPLYALDPLTAGTSIASPTFSLRPVVTQVHTLGSTASYAFGNYVLRNDSAVNLDQPLPTATLGSWRQGTQWQNVLGLDRTFDSDWTVGAQWQAEVREFTGALSWGSARVTKSFFRNKFEAELFVFKGLGNSEFWFQPQVSWNVSNSVSASLRWDYIASSNFQEAYLWSVQDQSRLLLWIKAKI
jgi:hypothetical protein